MIYISRRNFLKLALGLAGTAVLALTFKYGINNILYQNFSNNLNNPQYIFWNVPWGPGNRTYKLLNPYFQSNSLKLFYYVDMGNSTRIVELYNYLLNDYGVKLDIIGLELYGNYIYNNGNISISEYMINIIMQYKQFVNENNIKFFIGELRFRNGDLEGYISSGGLGYWDCLFGTKISSYNKIL